MENVESDPKTDRPKVRALGEERGHSSGSPGRQGARCLLPALLTGLPSAAGGDPH